MREIKFKLWHKGFKKFFTTNYSDQISMMPDGNIFWMGECETDNFTLLQYTGLKDKNGKEIYEGDIFRDNDTYLWEVFFEDGMFCAKGGEYDLVEALIEFIPEHCEIIGNIYENPELLEGDN